MLNKIKKLILVFTLLTFLNISAAIEYNDTNNIITGIVISNPWVRSAPPNASILGLFMQINNHTGNNIKLLSASASGYGRVELHRTIMQNTMMKMIKQDFMPIPAHDELHLEPGSWHIMLIDPNQVPHIGEQVEINLKFDNGTTQTIIALVKREIMKSHSMHSK